MVSDYFGLEDLDEAKAYYKNKILRKHLDKCADALLTYTSHELVVAFGEVDAKKVNSCMTLFYLVTKRAKFRMVIYKLFGGKLDENTIKLLER